MSKMESLCRIRDIYRAIAAFEVAFEKQYQLTLNEGMLLCTLSKVNTLSYGELADALGLSHSNASKVIRSVEDKGYITRVLGKIDKRQMYFSVTSEGESVIQRIKCGEMELPEILREVAANNSGQ